MRSETPRPGPEKILSLADLLGGVRRRRDAGERVVFTNGCFDILHAGHVRYLTAARACGDCLIIGLNSDASVRLIKGALRPLIDQAQRAEVLAALACVDYICLFDEPDPLRLITALQPDVLVKGGDWPLAQIIGAATVTDAGGAVMRIDLAPGISTTRIIERIIERYG